MKPYALNLQDDVIYTTTGQGCGERPNFPHAFDLRTRTASTLAPSRGSYGQSILAVA